MILQKGGGGEVMGTPGSLRAMPLWVKGGIIEEGCYCFPMWST